MEQSRHNKAGAEVGIPAGLAMAGRDWTMKKLKKLSVFFQFLSQNSLHLRHEAGTVENTDSCQVCILNACNM